MKKALWHIRRIERVAYPPHMRQMQGCFGIKDLAEYCECRPDQVFVLCGDNWYLIAAEHEHGPIEVVDFASIGPCREVFVALRRALPRWQGRRLVLDAREGTSYQLILALARRYRARVLRDDPWDWAGETMHTMELALDALDALDKA